MKKLALVLVVMMSSIRGMASSTDTWNFRFSPVGAIIGMIGAELDYKLTENIVVGPTLFLWNLTINDLTVKASGFGVQGAYYLNPVYTDGVYIGGLLSSSSLKLSSKSISGETSTASSSGINLGVKAGYHWFWNSFNLNLGGVVSTSSSPAKVQVKDTNGNVIEEKNTPGVGVGGDFLIGWTF